MKNFLKFIFLFFLLSCGDSGSWSPKLPMIFRPNESFPPAKYSQITKAMKIWNKALNFEVFEFSPEIISKGINPRDDDFIIAWGEMESLYLGKTYWMSYDIEINEDISVDPNQEVMIEEPLLTVLIHEFGHCMGLEHSPHLEDVMYFKFIGSKKPTLNDISRANEALGLPKSGGASGL